MVVTSRRCRQIMMRAELAAIKVNHRVDVAQGPSRLGSGMPEASVEGGGGKRRASDINPGAPFPKGDARALQGFPLAPAGETAHAPAGDFSRMGSMESWRPTSLAGSFLGTTRNLR